MEQIARGIGPASIDIAYERFGSPDSPAVLLIMGLAGQMIHWPDDLCQALVERSLQVIRFDNRDAGRSTHLTSAPPPDLPGALKGDLSSVSYTLRDMAGDGIGLLDHLGIARAHVVGVSMGGQIAQVVATGHPDRVLSLTSMMSTTGSPLVGQASPELLKEIFGRPPAATREEVIQSMVRARRAAGSPAFPASDAEIAELAGRSYDRSHDPVGVARQAIATVATGDRTEQLRGLTLPTLVIHGLADRMVDVSGGRATAEAIPGAELILIEGLGHDLPRELRPRLAGHIADLVQQTERGA